MPDLLGEDAVKRVVDQVVAAIVPGPVVEERPPDPAVE
jgi:hypothetical protein